MTVRDAFDEHARVLGASAALLPVLDEVIEEAVACLRAGGKILACGNGGSASDAQHFVAELVGRFERDRRALPAVALTTNSSVLTAIANDHGYDGVFVRQIEALARPGDLLVAISTSGNSLSVVEAARRAREAGCRVVCMTGEGGGKLGPLGHRMIAVPSRRTARIQEIHGLCLHALAGAIEERLSGAKGVEP
jgi:D-sedoheptulose 7-phosphate isomerase